MTSTCALWYLIPLMKCIFSQLVSNELFGHSKWHYQYTYYNISGTNTKNWLWCDLIIGASQVKKRDSHNLLSSWSSNDILVLSCTIPPPCCFCISWMLRARAFWRSSSCVVRSIGSSERATLNSCVVRSTCTKVMADCVYCHYNKILAFIFCLYLKLNSSR